MTVALTVVNAGLSDPSSTRLLADRLTSEFTAAVGDHVDVEVVDLRDLAVDIAHSMTAGFGVGAAHDALDAVYRADALIVATPVFNGSYSGLFKSFVDLVDVERLAGKPVLIGATGGSPRHSLVLDHALRPLFSYLRAVVMPTGVYAASQDWAGATGDTALLSDRIRRAAGELARAVGASAPASGESVRDRRDAVEAAGISTFAALLAG